ncbi:MAG: GTPase Era [Gammaproteobacteria bacterium]|nr:GTPase Era [Gammaproteobacteria bacterium]
MTDSEHRCGYVALVGRPNVGKSTLLNRLVGQKVSITAHRPQTTRHRILGIHSRAEAQIIYVDTPGIHEGQQHAINRLMNRAANSAMDDVDVVVFLVDGLNWTPLDEQIAERATSEAKCCLLAINKVDKLPDKSVLLPHLEELQTKLNCEDFIPISARRGSNVNALEEAVIKHLPKAAPIFPDDQITDRSMRFVASEIVREKLTRRLGQEVPYQLTVEIESFEERRKSAVVGAVIWVERDSHKSIVIGKQGRILKEIGSAARIDLEVQLGKKVHLSLWVKVRSGWSDNETLLRRFGYEP